MQLVLLERLQDDQRYVLFLSVLLSDWAITPDLQSTNAEPSDVLYVPEHYDYEDDVPHILAIGLSIGNAKDKFIFKYLRDSEELIT